MSRDQQIIQRTENSFICKSCGRSVPPPESGTENRNHCPYCLHSLHVDLRIGDRRSSCRALMEPIGIWVKPSGEWAIIHRCTRCGFIRTNRIAADDDEALLLILAARPLTKLPFPVARLLEKNVC